MIEGVISKKLKLFVDDRGWLMEILRRDWDVFEKFGQVYVTTAYPHVVKAWHMHMKQADHLSCLKGSIKVVLYDDRKNSKTRGELDEFVIGEKNPTLIKIPAEVWHGFKALPEGVAIVINVPTELYNYEEPDEYRLPPDTERIPYDWKMALWLKHG